MLYRVYKTSMEPVHEREEGQWFAVHTKPRQEHIAERNLRRQGYDCFLPRAQNPERKLPADNPRAEALFPRYIFVRIRLGRQAVATVNYTRGVHRIVSFGGTLAQVPEWIVARLKAATDRVSGLISLQPLSFRSGQAVEIFDGPLAGLRGVIDSVDGEQRALLLLELLGRENRLRVPAACLRPAR